MKQSVSPEILGKLLKAVQELNSLQNYGNEIENMQHASSENHTKNILAHIQNIHNLYLKDKYKDIHLKLSSREKEIILHICNGKKTSEIAHTLNLSKHTIESHRTNIFSKLDVKNAAELVALAYRIGLIS